MEPLPDPLPPAEDEPLRLQLFIAGNSPRSGRAVENLRRLGSETLEGRYELEIIDVLADPDRAEQARILTTPTVIRIHPPPARRVTGDLSRPADVLAALVPPLPRPRRRPGPGGSEEIRS